MPEPAERVVVNTTPIIALSVIGRLDLLSLLSGEVMTPPAVRSKILEGGSQGIGSTAFADMSWLRVVPLQDPRRADLDRGKAEVIALAQEVNADLIVLDERLARQHARRLGLKLTGTIGVLLKAKDRGFVPAVAPLIHDLQRGGIWLSDALVEQALRLARRNATAGKAQKLYAVLTQLPVSQRIPLDLALQLIFSNVLETCEVVALFPDDYLTLLSHLVEQGLTGGAVYDASLLPAAWKANADRVPTIR
jgi:hypothetical protein